jgi:N-acetylglutamate synthase-like GNAT family acetyltransferase
MIDPEIVFCEGLARVPPAPMLIDPLVQLQALLNQASFWAQDRALADLEKAIAHSKPVYSGWKDSDLIGFARATSDGVYRATIWDVVVHPDCRGQGVGRYLVEQILVHPHMQVERVYLMTTYQQRFYEKIGFDHNSSITMVFYPQAGP